MIKETLTLTANIGVGATFDENEVRELATCLVAADALAEKLVIVEELVDSYQDAYDDFGIWFYNPNEKITLGDFREIVTALRQYREAGSL